MIVAIDLPEALAMAVSRVAGQQGLTPERWIADRLADHFGCRVETPAPPPMNDTPHDD